MWPSPREGAAQGVRSGPRPGALRPVPGEKRGKRGKPNRGWAVNPVGVKLKACNQGRSQEVVSPLRIK